jgi:hypothetical protein
VRIALQLALQVRVEWLLKEGELHASDYSNLYSVTAINEYSTSLIATKKLTSVLMVMDILVKSIDLKTNGNVHSW